MCACDHGGSPNDFQGVLGMCIGRGKHLMSFCFLQQGNKQSLYQRSLYLKKIISCYLFGNENTLVLTWEIENIKHFHLSFKVSVIHDLGSVSTYLPADNQTLSHAVGSLARI